MIFLMSFLGSYFYYEEAQNEIFNVMLISEHGIMGFSKIVLTFHVAVIAGKGVLGKSHVDIVNKMKIVFVFISY